MKIESKYKNYTAEDFVEDKDFRDWVYSPSEILTSFWAGFEKDYPEKSETINQAKQIVKVFFIEERLIAHNEYQKTLSELKSYLELRSGHKKVVRLAMKWLNVAAILLLPILSVGIYAYVNRDINPAAGLMVQYIVPEGQKSKVILADGTQVWLNSGSKLTVAMGDKDMRKVKLSGEAFFDVTKNEDVPFFVETPEYSIKVYGTQFNVRSYDHQTESETILKEGSISIIAQNDTEIKMVPGQRFLINKEYKYSLSKVDPDLYISWKDNVLKIDNEKLQDLLVRIEHWYGVKISVENYDKFKDLKYTFTIKTESLRDMLNMMNIATPLVYRIDGERVYLKFKSNKLPMNK